MSQKRVDFINKAAEAWNRGYVYKILILITDDKYLCVLPFISCMYVYMCMHIYMYVYMYIYMYVYIHVYIYMYMYTYIYVCMCVFIYVYAQYMSFKWTLVSNVILN
jgi:hypothetical protein